MYTEKHSTVFERNYENMSKKMTMKDTWRGEESVSDDAAENGMENVVVDSASLALEEEETLRNEISRMSSHLESIKQRRLKLQLEKLKATVGMCFRIKDGLARVYDVPQIESHKIGDDINPYQIPVIVVGKNTNPLLGDVKLPVFTTTVYSRAIDTEDVQETLRSEYKEVRHEEFEEAMEKAFDLMRKMGR